jgi:hypothetical protein
MLTGIVCIASRTRAKMSTLQVVAPIPAFMTGSMLWLRRNGAVVSLDFEGIGLALGLVEHRDAQRNTKVWSANSAVGGSLAFIIRWNGSIP